MNKSRIWINKTGIRKYKIMVFSIASVLFLFFSLLSSCATSTPTITTELPSSSLEPVVVVLGPGDQIDIKFQYWPELNESQTIRPDGKISLQIVDEVYVAGLTPEQLDEHLSKLYESKLKNPDITVIVRSLASQRVYIGGEVETPGLIALQGKITVLQAVINSGGFRETAEPEETIVIRKDADNKPVPYRVDLGKVLNGELSGVDFQLQPYDIVYVPKSAIGNANQFIKQYIEGLLLFRGWGFNIDIND